MTTNQPRTVGRRLWWIIRTTLLIFIVIGLVAIVLTGLGYGGFLGVQELQRSANGLAARIDANEQNLNSLRELVNSEFAKGDPEQQRQIDRLENELAALNSQLEAMQAVQAEETAAQSEELDALQAELAAAAAQNSDLAGELETVQGALVALQRDLNSNGGRIDALGGDLDGLRLQLDALDSTLTEVTGTLAARSDEPADLQQTLNLLHLWGVLTNARLALIDGDVTVAETAVAQAITLVNTITLEADGPTTEALARLEARLELAAAGFGANLPMVAQDLEAASQELNLLLTGPLSAATVADATPSATITPGEGAATPASTPTSSVTPLPSPTPVPSPTATPTP